jgi:hypothetical protein
MAISFLTGFVTLVSLLGQYVGELRHTANAREKETAATIDHYKEWLRRENHEELVTLLESNASVSAAISDILKGNQVELLGAINKLERLIADVAMKVDALAPLAKAIPHQALLSPQAISILEQFEQSGAAKFVALTRQPDATTNEGRMNTASTLTPMGSGQNFTVSDQRLLNDDLDQLVEFGLLTPSQNKSGDRLFGITRAAVDFVNATKTLS